MESDDMDISTSGEEDDDDDDPELDKLLSSLTGMEKCFLPLNSGPGKAVTTQEKKPVSKTVASNESINSQDRAVTPPRLPINANRREEIKFRGVNGRNNSVISLSPTNSDDSNHSNASTLSRDGTPERRPSHCPKDCDNNQVQSPKHATIAQLLNKDSDSDVIIDHINRYRENLETNGSDHNDVACIGTKNDGVSLTARTVNFSTFSNTSRPHTETNDSIVLDDLDTSPARNKEPEIVTPAVISTETQSKQIDQNPPSEDDSDSDCLIVEHIAASDHRQNGLIDLTKPTSDDETSLPLQERTEESLLKEISKIRKALTKTKNTKKKHPKKGKKKRKSTKKKKRSKSKSRRSPSLDRVSDSDNERTIVVSESGQLSVNISNDRSKTDSEHSDDSAKTSKSTKSPPKDGRNLTSAIEKSISTTEKSTSVIEKSTATIEKSTATIEKSTPAIEKSTPAIEKSSSAVENTISSKENETESNVLPEPVDPSNEPDIEASPPLWNSDGENAEENFVQNPTSSEVIEDNPLRRKLANCANDSTIRKPYTKQIACESGKELKSKFRRKPKLLNWNTQGNKKKTFPFNNKNKFNRRRSNSEDSDSGAKKFCQNSSFRRTVPPHQRTPPDQDVSSHPSRFLLHNYASRRSVPPGQSSPPYRNVSPHPRTSFHQNAHSRRSLPPGQSSPPYRNVSPHPKTSFHQNAHSRRSVPPGQSSPPYRSVSPYPRTTFRQDVQSRRSVPPRQSTPPYRSVSPHPSTSYRQGVHSRRSVPPNDRFDKFLSDSDSDGDKINSARVNAPICGIAESYYRSSSISRDRTSPPLLHYRRSQSRNLRSLSRSPSCYQRRSPSSYRDPSHSRRSKSRLQTPPRNDDFERDRSIPKSNTSDELSFFSVFNRLRDTSRSNKSKSRTLLLSPSLLRRSKSRTLRSPSHHSRRSQSPPRRNPSWSRRSRSLSRSPTRSRRSKSRMYRSPSRSRRSKSRPYRSPSRSHRSRSRTYRSPSRSRRSRSRAYRSPSRSHRSKSRHRTPRRRSDSRSPSEIRAARKCSPLEDMRQQLRKDNEAAVRQALGGLEQPKKNPPVRIIDDVDLTKSPSPEHIPTIGSINATTASAATQGVVPRQLRPLHPYNATALSQNYSNFLHRIAGSTPMHPHPSYLRMPVPMVQNPSGILNQTSVFQISHVFSQAAGPPENYVPMYQPHPPYM